LTFTQLVLTTPTVCAAFHAVAFIFGSSLANPRRSPPPRTPGIAADAAVKTTPTTDGSQQNHTLAIAKHQASALSVTKVPPGQHRNPAVPQT